MQKKEINFYGEVESLVKKIYNYFRNSCSRIYQLQDIQYILDDPILKIKRLYEIRWLAWYEAIKNICNSIPALLQVFKESKNNDGQELYKQLTSWRMLAFLYYFYDILEYLVIFCSLLTAYVFIYIRRDSWNNPAFGTNFVESLNEGTYVTNVIVPAIRATLKNLPLGKSTFVSSSERQSSASADRKGDGRSGRRPDVIFVMKHNGKNYELLFTECSHLSCTAQKERDDQVKLW